MRRTVIHARATSDGVDARVAAREETIRRCVEACAAGDHEIERDVAQWRVRSELDADPATRADAWVRLLEALDHVGAAAATRYARATEAHDELRVMLDEVAAGPSAARSVLDPFVRSMRRLEDELGVAHSAATDDLDGRERRRAARTATGPTFSGRHAEDLAAFRAAEAPAWYAARIADRHGVGPSAAAEEAAALIDAEDHVAFLDETEAMFRAARGLPARGEGWVSAASLARCVTDVLPGVELVREARPSWLGGRQRLDIHLPTLDIAIEYQGEQHYLALDHWGGEPGLAARRELDERKRDACARAGVRLIEWRYDEPITVERVRRRLEETGVIAPE